MYINKMKKGLAIGTISLGLLFAGHTDVEAAYKDVNPSNWYVNEINELTEKGIISGDGANFHPKSSVTRAQASKIIWGAIENSQINVGNGQNVQMRFSDVSPSAWYSVYIGKMYSNGIISGYQDGTFKPGDSLTKAQAIKILVESFNIDGKSTVSLPFKDINSKQWHYPYIVKAHNAGIITKGFDWNFNPNEKITREQLVSYTSKAMAYHEKIGGSFEDLVFDRKDWTQSYEGEFPNSYKTMQEGLSNFDTVIYFDPEELDTPEKRREMMTNSFYRYTPSRYGIKSWVAYPSGKYEINYDDDSETTAEKMRRADDKAEQIIKDIIKPNFTDYDKVKAVHDYLVLNVAYDYDNWINGTTPRDSYSIYGALIDGVAVCDGYARSASYLLDKIGIENDYVRGYVDGGLHSWNLVKIDGEYYNIDTTHDDPVPNKEGYVQYEYFLVDDATMAKTRTWDEKELHPNATSKKYLNKQ